MCVLVIDEIQKTSEAGDVSSVKEIEVEAKAQSYGGLLVYAVLPLCQFYGVKDKRLAICAPWLAATDGSCLRSLVLEGEA